MPPREAWGLDIGQTALHAVKIKRLKGDACEIEDFYFQNLNTHLDDPEYDDKVVEALHAFVAEKKVGKTPVVVSLPGFTTLFRDFPLPAVSGGRLDEIVSYEAKQLIPYPLEEVIWDYHKLREDEDTGEIGIALVCCRRDIVEGMLGILDEAKLNVEALQVGPVALVNYVEYETPPEEAALILDTGARGTDFIILNDGAFWLRSIGVSGTDLTKVLMSKFSIPYEKAEELKFEVGDSKQGDRVFRVMEPVLRNLCGEVQRSVGYYKSLFRGVNLNEIICAGNTYLLSGVDQFLADNTGLPARTLGAPEEVGVNFAVDESEIEAHRQVLGTAAGLALQGIGLAEINTTLLPAERRLAKVIRGKLKYAAAATGAVALAVLVNLLTVGGGTERFGDLMDKAKQAVSRASAAEASLKKVEAKFPEEVKRIQNLASVAPSRGYLKEAMAAVHQAVEKINTDSTREQLVQQAVGASLPRMMRQVEEKFELTGGDEGDADAAKTAEVLRKKIQGQARTSVEWQHRAAGSVKINKAGCRVVKVQRVENPQTKESWWALPEELPGGSGSPYSPSGGSTPYGSAVGTRGETVEAVEVKLQGYMATNSLAQSLGLKNGLGAIEGVLDFQFDPKNTTISKLQWVPRPNQVLNVRAPAIEKPKVIEDTAGTTPAAGAATARSAGKTAVPFMSVPENTIDFETKFYYLPSLHKTAPRPQDAAGNKE